MTQHTHLTDIRLDSLDLHLDILEAAESAGFSRCTPIQAETLPKALAGVDIAGQAQTGTGKTAAFLLTIFHRLLTREAPPRRRRDQPRALILAPTRELAVQIHKDAQTLSAGTDLALGLAFGGTDYEKQRATIAAGVDVLIGTPGRLIDYYKQKIYNLKAVEVAVLDEADRMFDLGFISDIRYLLRRMPPAPKRLNMLFSATLSYRVLELAYEHMNDPRRITIEHESITADNVRETLYHVSKAEKIGLLLGLLEKLAPSRALIFINTKRAGERVHAFLRANGFEAAILSGDVPQNKRLRLLRQFKEDKLPILVATDVAARGLHIPDVSHVFNFDLPQDAEDYVHRVGRTARAGASGDAVSLCCEEYVYSLPAIEEYIGHKIPAEMAGGELMITPKKPERRQRSHKKPSGKAQHKGRPRRRHAKNASPKS
jgi:ATP-dependent RNA helicase RhlB